MRTMIKSKKFRNGLAVGLVFFCVGTSLGEVLAYNTYSPLDESRHDYNAGTSRKFGRGLANTGLGWTEIFRGMEEVGSESGFWAGITWGPFYGASKALKRTGAGVYEAITFPFAGPNHFEPITEPEFPLSDS